MHWSSASLPALAVLLVPCVGSAADSAVTNYFPPETKVVIGIQVPAIVGLVAQNFGAEAMGKSMAMLASTPLAGFDPAKDLDEVLIATSGKGNNPPALVVLRGRFDVDRLGKGAKDYHGVPILEDPQKPDGILALLDGTTALAGDAALVHGAIDQKSKGESSGSSWAERIEPLRSRYAVWGIGEGLEGIPATPGEAQGLNSLDRFEFGAAFAHGLDLTAALHLRSTEDARKLSAFLKLIQAAPQTSGAKMNVEMADDTIRIAVQITEDELKKAIAAQRATLAAAVISQLGGKPAAPPEARIVTNAQGDTISVTLPGKR